MVDRAPARHVSAAEWEQTVRISCSFVRPDKYRVCVSAADGAEWPQDFHSHSLTANGDASISWVAVAREDADMTALPHVCREDATDADVLYWLKRVTDGPMEVRPEPTIFPAENGADDTPSEGFSGRLTSGNGRIRVDVDPDGFPKRVVVTSCHPGCEVLEIEVTSYELNPDFPPGTFAVGKEDGRPGNLAL